MLMLDSLIIHRKARCRDYPRVLIYFVLQAGVQGKRKKKKHDQMLFEPVDMVLCI